MNPLPHGRHAGWLLVAAATVKPATQAQTPGSFPARPIHPVVPFTPGGSTAILARSIGQELTKAWGNRSSLTTSPAPAVAWAPTRWPKPLPMVTPS